MKRVPGSSSVPGCQLGEVFITTVFNVGDEKDLGYETARIDFSACPETDDGYPLEGQYHVFVSEEEFLRKQK
jgi:hypothetical protein